jgi:hypothetical protein
MSRPLAIVLAILVCSRRLRQRPECTRNNDRRQGTATAQFGAGVDVIRAIKVSFPIGLRGDVRDWHSVIPTSGTTVQGGGQHNVVISGGVVLYF